LIFTPTPDELEPLYGTDIYEQVIGIAI
jgi:hypothetical protein